MKVREFSLIDKMVSLCIRMDELKDTMDNNIASLRINIDKYKDSTTLLYEVMHMKKDNAISANILKYGNEPLSH